MAIVKISELPVVSAPADSDIFVIVDANGPSTKRITVGDLNDHLYIGADSAYVNSQISLIDLGADSAFVTSQISLIDIGADSAFVTSQISLIDSDLTNYVDVNTQVLGFLINSKDSDFVKSAANQSWIQSNQITYTTADFTDSAGVISLISANETPQDFAYSSLTGTPTVLDSAAILAIPGVVSESGTDSAAVISLIKATQLDVIKESFTTDASGSTVPIDLNINSTVLATGLASNFGLVFTNVPTTGKTTIGTAVIINQTSPSWTADSATINGTSAPILWLGGAQPLGNDSCTEIFNFTIINDSGSYTLLGSATDYK
jgi:hypothetical protein